jgi:lysyl-tRNA synthetase class 1
MFGVTFEAFGKDHAAAGSSWDTGKHIVKTIYEHEAPTPLVYEFINLKGRGAMHGSTGTAVAAEDMLQMTPPEVLRFLIMKTEPARHIDFDTGLGLLDLVDEYDRYERIVFDKEEEATGIKDVDRIYWLSQPDPTQATTFPVQVPYRHLVTVVQIADTWGGVQDVLRRTGEIDTLNKFEAGTLKDRVAKVRYWLKHSAPEQVKFEVKHRLPDLPITPEMKSFFTALAGQLREEPWAAENIHQAIYAVAQRQALSPSHAFRFLYRIILGQAGGPRAGYFIHSLGREFILDRLEVAAA